MQVTSAALIRRSALVGATAMFVLMWSGVPAPPNAAASVQVPREIRDRAARFGSTRAIVELKLPSPPKPEGDLRTVADVLNQRQNIAAQRGRVLSRLPAGAHRVVHEYETAPYIALDVSAAALATLETLTSDVVSVMPDAIVRPGLMDSVPLVQGDQAWASGYDGTGTTIAVLDTGVDAAHPFLSGKVVEEACYSSTVAGTSQTFCPNGLDQQIGPGAATPCPLSDCLHGTHVAGIAAGNGTNAGVAFSGVAKGAHLIAMQVFSRVTDPTACGGIAPCVGGFTSDVIAGLERVYTLASRYNIASVNLSLGGGLFASPCDNEPYKPIIDNLRAIGIATVVAAGNSGATWQLSSPACISSAVSVGSTNKSDAISWFSNIAPFLSLLAPGESITSSVPGGAYLPLSGTSMATPHVAGAWSVLKQAVPSASVSTILSAFQQTGLPIADTRFFGAGTTVPRIRLFQALASLVAVTNPQPSIATLSPTNRRAGSGSFTLTITGTGFNAFTVAQWNGAARPTTVVNTTKLQTTIPATDLSVVGTALVSVATPAPGGGTSSALTFTIDPPPTLTPSATSVAPGGSVTVTLANGLGGSSDWLALAESGSADTSYLQWTYVGAGVASRTWTVTMPSLPGGTYEFRLFLNNGYVRAATSPAVTVTGTLPTLTVDATSVVGGGNLTVTLTNGLGGASDWLALAATTAPNTSYVTYTYVGSGVTTRTWTVTAPLDGGIFEFRLFPNNGYTRVATSAPVNVTPGSRPVPALSGLSPTNAIVGGSSLTLTVNGTGFVPSSVVRWNGANRPTTYVSATQLQAQIGPSDLAGVGTAQVTVFSPAPGGGLSNALTFTIASAPVLAVSATSVQPGGNVTVTLTGGLGGASDWLAFAPAGASDFSYLQYVYIGSGVTTRTWTVTTPTASGTYEFRLFLNNGYTRAATSPIVTVGP